MDILDDIEIVDVPKRAQEIREAKLAEINKHIEEVKEKLNNVSKHNIDVIDEFFNSMLKNSYITILNYWIRKKNKILEAKVLLN